MKMKNPPRPLVSPLKRWIDASGLSEAEVSRRLGVSKMTVNNWVHAQSIPELAIAGDLAKLLKITLDRLRTDILSYWKKVHDGADPRGRRGRKPS